MENEQKTNLVNSDDVDIDDEDAFGPHEKDKKFFFTKLNKEQNLKNNSIFIKWETDMKKLNYLIIHCPFCNAYFTTKPDYACSCSKCRIFFCFGWLKDSCEGFCIKWFKVAISFLGHKGYGDKNLFLKILMFFSLLFQMIFSFPLQILYKLGPLILDDKGSDDYATSRKKGIYLCILMLPYQIA